MSKEEALHILEIAFVNWYEATSRAMPDIGILVLGLSHEGCDLQYLGVQPSVVVDWPYLFADLIEQLERGNFRINTEAAVDFRSQR
jgi:hypothetical protein